MKVLEVRENRLKTLPKSLVRLAELERLDLGTNEFDVFVSFFFKLCFKNCRFINSLSLFKPEVICQIPSLLEIWMDNNKIEYIPDVSADGKHILISYSN